ncbi:L,D-transpeptidase [Patescibacteria group bacterium]
MPKISKRFFIIALPIAFVILSLLVYFQTDSKIGSVGGCQSIGMTGEIDVNDRIAIFEGQEIGVPKLAYEQEESPVLGISNQARWIEVDLSDQRLTAWEGNSKFLETSVSTGLPWWPTPEGEYRIWIKLRATKMEGGSGKYYYYLPNVPYVMFFENDKVPGWKGFGLHGTYWHDDFGTPRSHGCVNLPTPIAEKLYHWVGPVISEGKGIARSSNENPGTKIIIHQ